MFVVVMIIVPLAVLAASVTLVSVARAACCRATAVARSTDPHDEANRLLLFHVLPTWTGVALVAAVVPTIVMFEPRGSEESFGYTLWALAVAGAALAGRGFFRTAHGIVTTAGIARAWRRASQPVTIPKADLPTYCLESDRPLVALVGILRPRLFISRRVLDECPLAQLQAMSAHELAHAESRDNLKRLALLLCFDPLGLARYGQQRIARWHALSEEAADKSAITRGISPLDLAAAIVAVTRMGQPVDAGELASGFQSGLDVTRRLQRLLQVQPDAPRSRPSPRFALVFMCVVLAAVLAVPGYEPLVRNAYLAMEAILQRLP